MGGPKVTAAHIASDRKALQQEQIESIDDVRQTIVKSLEGAKARAYEEMNNAPPGSMLRGTMLQNIIKADEQIAKVTGALVIRSEVTTNDDARRQYSALRGALASIVVAYFGRDECARLLTLLDRLASGEQDALDELRSIRIINVQQPQQKRLATHEDGLEGK